jgi:hypothetical protein
MSRIRKHFTFANATMTVALVFVMTGGAYAASKYVISSTKQISPKVLAALKGKAGANGAQGSAGPAGAQGPAGAAGAKGETGAAGQNGTQGEKGVQGEKGTAGTNGFNGTPGAKGTTGPEGSPWTDKGTLPVGSSETGQWAVSGVAMGKEESFSDGISFTIELASAPGQDNSHFIGVEEGEGEPKANVPAGCKGSYKDPQAESGNLCVFANKMTSLETNGLSTLKNAEEEVEIKSPPIPGIGAGKSGVIITLKSTPSEQPLNAVAYGVWTVTA